MPQFSLKNKNIQVVLFQGSKRVKAALLGVIVLTAAALGTLHLVERQMQEKIAEFNAQSAVLTYENSKLDSYITEDSNSTQRIQRIAQEELGMVPEDAILIEAQVK